MSRAVGSPQAPGTGGGGSRLPLSGRGSSSGVRQCFSLWPLKMGPLHAPHSSVSGPSVAYILQSGPARGLSPPVAREGAFFSIPQSPSR